jgi:hypothetical protein
MITNSAVRVAVIVLCHLSLIDLIQSDYYPQKLVIFPELSSGKLLLQSNKKNQVLEEILENSKKKKNLGSRMIQDK